MTREYREYAKSRIEYLLKICKLDERDKEALEAAIQALEKEGIYDDKEHYVTISKALYDKLNIDYEALSQEPCDEKKDCSTCKYEECSSNNQPCRDCGTLLESYTNWEQKERELPCIYDLKNRYCPRLNEHGMLKYGFTAPDMTVHEFIEDELPSVTQKSGKWIKFKEFENGYYHIRCSECGQYWSIDRHAKVFKYCFNCGAKMESEVNNG